MLARTGNCKCVKVYVTVPKQSLSQVLPQRPFAFVFECCPVSPTIVVIASAALAATCKQRDSRLHSKRGGQALVKRRWN